MREVAVTGIGAVTPLGVGARTLHARWAAGEVAIAGGEAPCTAFDPLEFFSRKEARRADRFTQLALASAREALDEAGWADGAPYEADRVGCILGTGIGGIGTLEDNFGVLRDQGPERVAPLAVPLMMSNAGSAAIAMRHDLRGPVFGVVSACAAGANAIAAATRAIQCGDADAIVTGGSEAALTPLARAAFAALDAVSTAGVSRPFDARRDGFIMGEGAGVLVLEDAAQARARGATILALVRGIGATCDAHHLTAPRPDGAGAAAAMTAALRDAGLEAADVDYVNAHGTSTPLNDRAETMAIKTALGDRAAGVPISSTKSAIGHLLGAAGAVEAIATILTLRERVIAPTLGLEEPDEGLDLDYVPGSSRALDISAGRSAVGISNSLGFGGHNAVLVLEAA
ncbi:MAG: 3-oxoacyl-[acyl-carrier-protein] synthase [Solirubrobacteraceae bacterium]|jgi:3-oxoacyl-[acyl-carrier-protein] synthase II|nr:3-oxoacyl-[acyl-carrier-protein] synthase [Solirubrobacteraceae bacterium]